jgi:hypothetical protein
MFFMATSHFIHSMLKHITCLQKNPKQLMLSPIMLKVIPILLWTITAVIAKNTAEDLFMTESTDIPTMLYCDYGFSQYSGGFYRLTNTTYNARPSYQNTRYDNNTISYQDNKWIITSKGRPWWTNPAQTRIPPQTDWLWGGAAYAARNVVLYSYPEELSPPANITLKTGYSADGVSGHYTLMSNRHNEFPVYKGQGLGRYLFVRQYKSSYLWTIGSKISYDEGFPITRSSVPADFHKALPASSPASWPDWTNIGTLEEPILQFKKENGYMLSNPPANITLKTGYSADGISGYYTLLSDRHIEFPVYKGQGLGGYLFVKGFTLGSYLWAIGSKISYDEGSPISTSGVPADSPASWPDWTNIGTLEEPILQFNKENGYMMCLDERYYATGGYHILKIKEEDTRRCNRYKDCVGGPDEEGCTMFTDPKIYFSLGITAVVIVVAILIFQVLRCWGLFEIESDVGVLAKTTKMTDMVDSLTRTIQQDEFDWAQSDYMKSSYKLLHQTQGGIKMFLHTTMSLLEKPATRYKIACFAMKMEKELHDCEDEQTVSKCWQKKIGSNKTSSKIFYHMKEPGCKKSVMFNAIRCSNFFVQKMALKLLKQLISLARVFGFSFDSVKDILLWVYLLSRFQALYESESIDGGFVVVLIWSNGVTIFLAQSLMGFYIANRADRMFKLPEHFLKMMFTRCILFILTPFVPCLVILKVTSIRLEKEKLINNWRTSSTQSPTTVAMTVIKYEKRIGNTCHTYAMLKLIEAVIESLPQLVLLLGYLTVSISDNQALSISENVESRWGAIFFGLNILHSFLTLITSIVNSIDIMKGNQLSLKQKVVLAVSYTFQTGSRIIPIFSVIYLAIGRHISKVIAIHLLTLPIVFHWILQYTVCLETAPYFEQLKFFDQILHVLINTFFVIPLRPTPAPGHQVHKSRQMYWSFVLLITEVMVISVISTIVLLSADLPPGTPVIIILLTTITCLLISLLLGPLTLILFYYSCHTWRAVNRQRERPGWCSAWCSGVSLGLEIEEEGDVAEDIEMDVLGLCDKEVSEQEKFLKSARP